MNEKFTVGQVVAILAIIFGSVILGYVVLILSRLATAIKNVNGILETNKENIDNTMDSIPGIVSNVNEITGSVKRKTDLLDSLFGEKEGDGDSPSIVKSLESIISSITSIFELFKEVKGFFGEKKRQVFKIKK